MLRGSCDGGQRETREWVAECESLLVVGRPAGWALQNCVREGGGEEGRGGSGMQHVMNVCNCYLIYPNDIPFSLT